MPKSNPIPMEAGAILDTVENFLDTCPDLQDAPIKFGGKEWSETLGAWVQSVRIGEVRWNIAIARGE